VSTPFGRRTAFHYRNALSMRLQEFFDLTGAPNRLLEMEGLRGIAVVLVFFVHFHEAFNGYLPPGGFSSLFSDVTFHLGHCGVDLFFVISGYLIYGALVRNNRPVRYGEFMRRRIQRIYPTYLTVLCLYVVVSFLVPHLSKLPGGLLPNLAVIAANVLLLPGVTNIIAIIVVSWSLSYELFYYLTLPLLVTWFRMPQRSVRGRMILLLVAGAAVAVYCIIWLRYGVSPPHRRMSMFLVGMLVYECRNTLQLGIIFNRWAETAVVLYLGVAAWALYLLRTHSRALQGLPGSDWLLGLYDLGLVGTACGGTALYSFAFPGVLRRVFRLSWLRGLGNMSYSYYLIHGATVNAVELALQRTVPRTPQHPWLYWFMLPTTFSATLLSASCLYGLVEKRWSIAPPKPANRQAVAAPAATSAAPL